MTGDRSPVPEGHNYAGMTTPLRRSLAEAPSSLKLWQDYTAAACEAGRYREARWTVQRVKTLNPSPAVERPVRSIVIPVLDYSPNSPYDIVSLLADLQDFDGEVICVFNSAEMFADLSEHPRIDKFSFNKHNIGVSRSWNTGINQAEGDVIFVLNADLKVSLDALAALERYVLTLPRALAVGINGNFMSFDPLRPSRRIEVGSFAEPFVVDTLSGFAFALHAARLHDAGISFDPRLSPHFFEEVDLVLKARRAGYDIYAAPVTGIEHVAGISLHVQPLTCFGKPVDRIDVLIRNGNIILDRYENEPGAVRAGDGQVLSSTAPLKRE
ncbi:MAG: glycosyltransferase [Alphaproteobacteria bacterium]|nr:glycosyltransferase [Alphaproteobacteria bacterium]